MSGSIEKLPEFGAFPTSFVDVLSWRARHEADRIAYVFLADGETREIPITYAELHERAQAIAGMLQQQKIGGERCLLIYPPGLDFLAAFFGCLYAGVVAVPVYPPRKDRDMIRILAVINNSNTALVLTTSPILARFEKIKTEGSLPELNQLQWLASDQADEIHRYAEFWTKPELSGKDLAFLQYTSGSTALPKGVMVSHGNLIYNQRMLTPSTAHTKECVLVTWLPLYHDMGLIGNILHPLYIGFKCVFMSPEAFLQKPFRWLQAITRYKATTTGGAPNFAFDLCNNRITPEQIKQLDLSSWKFALVGSDTVRHDTLERFIELFSPCGFHRETFYPAYGLAEATLIASGGLKEAPPIYLNLNAEALTRHQVIAVADNEPSGQTLVGCGRTWLDQKIVIVNPENMTPCEPDQVGEIWVTGENVAQGYWNNEEQTQKLLKATLPGDNKETYLRTGDLGFLRNGELFITGRLKNLIIIRGRNHYPQDIEATVESSVSSLRAGCSAVFTIEHDNEEKLVVVAELERRFMSERRSNDPKMPLDNRTKSDRRQFNEEDTGSSQPDRDLILDECFAKIRHSIAENHGLQTHGIVLIRPVSLPKTTSGKIRRLDCRQQFLNNELVVIKQSIESSAPTPATDSKQTPVNRSAEAIQSWLLTRLSAALKLARHQIDPRVELFQYGLDSLSAVSITGELEDWLGKTVSPTIFYNYPTIRAICSHLTNTSNKQATEQIELRSGQLTTPVAIIGSACRFPGADSPDDFWKLLTSGRDAITEIPAERWESMKYYDPKQGSSGKMNSRWGGFLTDIDQFDPFFFGISPREANYMDPQQRILLEVSWEAFENAGLDISRLAGSKTGVFIGISNSEYARLTLNDQQELNAFQGTGNALSIASNRISYQFDLHGPSISLDTACSSSLVSVHMACQSLRNGESTLALAGGVNLILTPETSIIFSQANMMAADGKCKTFDESADGYVRSEGCGLVVLKLLPDAIRDGDEILAVIRGSAVNQDGRSNGITAPNGLSQQVVITQALKNAGVEPAQVSYIEAHGTGTSLGDPIEMDSLKAVLMQNRTMNSPCLIGSVKTNLGHMESAAGIAGLLKVVLSLKHGLIPANLHFKKLNPHISLAGTPLSVPVTTEVWPEGAEKRLAGVSSFGFGGTNAHLVLEAAPKREFSFQDNLPCHLLTLSARNSGTLRLLAKRYLAQLETIHTTEQLARLCYSTSQARTHLEKRLALVAESPRQLRDSLTDFLNSPPASKEGSTPGKPHQAARVVFVFPDKERFYTKMGQGLYQKQPGFKGWIDQCDAILAPILDTSLVSLLYGTEAGKTEYIHPLLFAVEYSLAKMWTSWGIIPDLLVGYGPGKIVAACLAGVFNLETGLKLAVELGRLGSISGSADAISRFEKQVSEISFADPGIPIFHNATGEIISDPLTFTASFWLENEPSDPKQLNFQQTLKNYRFLINLGQGRVPEHEEVDDQLKEVIYGFSVLSQSKEDWAQSLETLGKLYQHGVNIDWSGFYRDYSYLQSITLPNYPFQRKRYWIGDSNKTKPVISESSQVFYENAWEIAEIDSAISITDRFKQRDGYWLILADKRGVGTELARLLANHQNNCILVFPGDHYQNLSSTEITINFNQADDFERLLSEISVAKGPCQGILHLWNLDHKPESKLNEKSIRQAIKLGSYSLLFLAQAMTRLDFLPARGVWLVTTDTQSVSADKTSGKSLAQWPLWGLGKSLALELPDFKVGLVDLSNDSVETNALQLMQEISTLPTEWQVAYSNGQRFVARISKSPITSNKRPQPFPWQEDATYVITGGLGKLGLKTAESIANQGARQIVLIGRTALPDVPQKQDDELTQAQKVVQDLQAKGVTVKTFQADVSNMSSLKKVFATIRKTMPDVRGIFHAAGVVSKNSLSDLSEKELTEILAAKVYGTWALHQLSLDLDLDCFVLFSSISSVWGSREIAHYSAANAFLDGFCFYRKSLQLPVLSINWGPWVEGGMTGTEEQSRMARIGIRALEPDLALDAMNQLLAAGRSSQIVAAVDWSRLKPLYESIGYGSLFANILPSAGIKVEPVFRPPSGEAPPQKTWLNELTNLDNKEKILRLTNYLKGEIAHVMRCDPDDIDLDSGFFDMGMDSLMAVELRDKIENELACSMDATLLFDYPNINALVQYLLGEIIGEDKTSFSINEVETKTNTKSDLTPQVSEIREKDIKHLSEDEIARLIDEELKDTFGA